MAPESVIHITFDPVNVWFNPALVWGELRKVVQHGNLSEELEARLIDRFRDTALSIATRSDLMRVALNELNKSVKELFDSVPQDALRLLDSDDYVVGSDEVTAARDRVLLHTDSVFFECRSYLEFLAKFVYGILDGIQAKPSPEQTLSSGEKVQVATLKGVVRTHNFLLFLCNQLPTSDGAQHTSHDWFVFLSCNRNLFAHGVAPYCAIEQREDPSRRFDVLIMRKNILDFKTAKPADYFRISELQGVLTGIKKLSQVAQLYVMEKIAALVG